MSPSILLKSFNTSACGGYFGFGAAAPLEPPDEPDDEAVGASAFTLSPAVASAFPSLASADLTSALGASSAAGANVGTKEKAAQASEPISRQTRVVMNYSCG